MHGPSSLAPIHDGREIFTTLKTQGHVVILCGTKKKARTIMVFTASSNFSVRKCFLVSDLL